MCDVGRGLRYCSRGGHGHIDTKFTWYSELRCESSNVELYIYNIYNIIMSLMSLVT